MWFQFSRQSVFVKVYYFYVQDAEFGPGFIKIGDVCALSGQGLPEWT